VLMSTGYRAVNSNHGAIPGRHNPERSGVRSHVSPHLSAVPPRIHGARELSFVFVSRHTHCYLTGNLLLTQDPVGDRLHQPPGVTETCTMSTSGENSASCPTGSSPAVPLLSIRRTREPRFAAADSMHLRIASTTSRRRLDVPGKNLPESPVASRSSITVCSAPSV
jgi:hypothetical protein